MGDKVKRYKVKEAYKEFIDKIEFPQFFIKVTASDIFGTDEELHSFLVKKIRNFSSKRN